MFLVTPSPFCTVQSVTLDIQDVGLSVVEYSGVSGIFDELEMGKRDVEDASRLSFTPSTRLISNK